MAGPIIVHDDETTTTFNLPGGFTVRVEAAGDEYSPAAVVARLVDPQGRRVATKRFDGPSPTRLAVGWASTFHAGVEQA